MAVYEYRAVRETGEAVTGALDAESARQARELLRHHGFYVSEMHQVRAGARGCAFRRLLPFQRRKSTKVLWLTRELHLLVLTGMPLRDALASLARSAPRGMGHMLRGLRDDITKGDALGTALSRRPDWFDGLYVSMIQAGERSGELGTVLGDLTRFLTAQEDFRRQMQTALLYPKLVALAAFAVVVFLMSSVVPRFVAVITKRGGRLPLPTVILQRVSGFFAAYWPWCVAGALGVWLVCQVLLMRPGLRLLWEQFLMRVPVVGPLRRKRAAQQFSAMLCVLLRGGVVLAEALGQLSETSDNPLVAREADGMRQRLLLGGRLTTTAGGGGIFPASFSDMLAAGQESGSLRAVLETVSQAYSTEVEALTKKVAAIVEPLAILLVAGVVAFVVAAVLLPVFELSQVQ